MTAKPTIFVKRVYETPCGTDGLRILVDRLWPRGLTKGKARVDVWAKDIAPSTELRRWFHADSTRWDEFRKRYLDEVKSHPEAVTSLRAHIGQGPATLLFGTRDIERNHALLLRDFLME